MRARRKCRNILLTWPVVLVANRAPLNFCNLPYYGWRHERNSAEAQRVTNYTEDVAATSCELTAAQIEVTVRWCCAPHKAANPVAYPHLKLENKVTASQSMCFSILLFCSASFTQLKSLRETLDHQTVRTLKPFLGSCLPPMQGNGFTIVNVT